MEAALSRVGECYRVGCNQSFLYFFQRLHVYCVAEAYSILPKMENNFNRKLIELWSTPMELFGLPDILPIFSLYCRGNGNNYRLYNFGDQNTKLIIEYLFKKAQKILKEEDFLNEDIEYQYSLQTRRFMYEMYNRSIKYLRKK